MKTANAQWLQESEELISTCCEQLRLLKQILRTASDHNLTEETVVELRERMAFTAEELGDQATNLHDLLFVPAKLQEVTLGHGPHSSLRYQAAQMAETCVNLVESYGMHVVESTRGKTVGVCVFARADEAGWLRKTVEHQPKFQDRTEVSVLSPEGPF